MGNQSELRVCQPADANPTTAAADRFAMMNYAVNKLKANPGTSVYLDGTHSGWLGAGDAADRLIQAGVLNADGFFLNVSNYVVNPRLEKYGTWWQVYCLASNPASWGMVILNGVPASTTLRIQMTSPHGL